MVKHIFQMTLAATCLLSPAAAFGGIQSADEARKVAAEFFRESDVRRLSDTGNLTLAHTATAGATPSYYVFNANDGHGFIIVSADNTVSPVIGYSTTSSWHTASVPAETRQLLGQAGLPKKNMVARYAARATDSRKVLATAPWSQEAPFNNNIPNRRLVGCVGTALAEILKYHSYPASRPASLCKPGESTEYDWAGMRTDNYRSGYSMEEAEAVATLVSDAAIAIGTDFGMSSSSAFEVRVPAALVETFGYDAGVSYKKGSEMDRASWDALIINEIDEGRPVLYSGQDVSAGHAFVCDGYEMHGQTPYFHINWGWGGAADGFYASDALNPTVSTSHSFNNLTTIVYNIKPATSAKEWSPVHITGDGNQVGMTMNVSDLSAGTRFSIRAGALKNISGRDFSGNISAALYGSDGSFKKLLGDGRNIKIMSLQIVDYADFSFTVPADAAIAEGDVVRLVARESAGQDWLPVANDLITTGYVSARGYTPPYFNIDISDAGSDVEVIFDQPRVIKGRDFTFKVNSTSADKVVTVKANGFILTPDADSNYRIANVNSDQEVAVIVQNAADVVSKRNIWVNAGNLQNLISDTDAGTIKDLTLYGTIDATDFAFMRDRMKLTRLDISCVSIVASGANPANAIPTKAFSDCSSLRQIILPKNITTFKSGCFRNSGLESVEIPASVATYEYNVFVNCPRLREVVARRATPSWVNWCVFHGTPKARLVVPVGAAAAYKNKEYWQDFAVIEEENPTPASHYEVITEDIPGLRFIPVSESNQVTPGSAYKFKVETDDSFGDSTMEMYANNTRIYADANGIYTAGVNANTLIHATLRQPEDTRVSSWKITPAAGGIGLVTDVVNVVAGKSFTIRANALAIPSDDAALFYCAALTDKDDRIKELISPVTANYSYNAGNLPASFTCQVKDAAVREGNRVRIVTSYDKKKWSVVKGESDGVCDHIDAIGNKVVYHEINMPQSIAGAVIQGAVSKIVSGMPLSLKVTPVSVDDRITVAVNGINKIVDAAVANLSIASVTEDLDIAIQVVPKGADSYTVVNVREGELAAKIEQCPARLKVTGVMTSDDFKAFGSHAGQLTDLDLADVTVKGNGDLANAIPTNAFAPSAVGTSSALKKIILPSNLVNVESNAFNRCLKLSEITLPASVAYVGSGAFSSCLSLKKIIMLGNQPPSTAGITPFPANVSITLEVPHGSEANYNSAQFWKDLAQATSKRYFNIQIDPERCFNMYPNRANLGNIEYPGTKIEVAIGLPSEPPTSYKDNPIYRPGVAFKLYDNGKDVTYTWLGTGQYKVMLDPGYENYPTSVRKPQNHVIDVVLHYALEFDKPAFVNEEFIGLADDEKWSVDKYYKFVEGSEEKPVRYKEGRDYRFRLSSSVQNAKLKVTATSKILTKPGANPEYRTTEQLLVADENGIYTVSNLQGDTRITVTSSVAVEEGMTLSTEEIAMVDGEDAFGIRNISVSGDLDENSFGELRDKFSDLESLNMSETTNESIPDNALSGMQNLRSVVLPDNVVSIGENAFADCPNLESVTLPSVTHIGGNAFNGCGSLTSITILGQEPAPAARSAQFNAPATPGMDDASFAGLNPNCLIFLPEGSGVELSESFNVIINKSGSRSARNNIVLDAAHPFNTPASFNLDGHRISMTVNIPGSISDDNDRWTGIVMPFAPTRFEPGKDFTPRDEKFLTLLTFADEDSETLTETSVIEANRPYLASVYAPLDTVPVIFSATELVSKEEDVYDVPFTPASEEIVAKGRNFSLYGCLDPDNAGEDILVLDDNGMAFVTPGEDKKLPGLSVFARANGADASGSLEVGTHPVWVFNPTASEESGATLYRSSAIELTSATSGARILYTLDGSDPLVNGMEYTGPFSISDETAGVKAIAVFKENMSEVANMAFSLKKSSVEYILTEGWNWISHNLETPLPLENVMTDNMERILSQTEESIRDPKFGLVGNLKSLDPAVTYKVYASAYDTHKLAEGISFDPATPVKVNKGWNWIGCPVDEGSLDVNDLLSGFEPEEGDMIISRTGIAQADADGRWIGSLGQLRPGEGYMLLSAVGKEFTFRVTPMSVQPSPESVAALPATDDNATAWVVESGKYPSVMPVISKLADGGITIDDMDGLTVGAFCGDECRGIGAYAEGYVMINVFGNPGDIISFRLYANADKTESRLPGEVRFSENPVGSLKDPYLIDMATASAAGVTADGAYEISVDNGILHVKGGNGSACGIEVYDTSGIMIACADRELRTERLVPGVYVIKMNSGNGARTIKVNVR